jgi:transcriptional regulator with XRE-family HTH domain
MKMTRWFFADYIRRLLKQKEWTANKLAEKSGISHSFVGTLLRGGRSNDKYPPKISVDTLIDLTKALKVPEMNLFLAYQGIDPDQTPQVNLTFDLSTEVKLSALRAGVEWHELPKTRQKQVLEAVTTLTRKFVDMTVEHELGRSG